MAVTKIIVIYIAALLTSIARSELSGDQKVYGVDPITEIKDCKYFQNSQNTFARCNVYFEKDMFFYNKEYTAKFEECLFYMPDKSISRNMITVFDRDYPGEKGLKAATAYSLLYRKTLDWVTLIPQINVVLGPGGDSATVLKTPPLGGSPFGLPIIVGASEKEDTSAAYSDEFILELNKTIHFATGDKKLLRLNGWHIKNMAKKMDWPGFAFFSGLVIYVDAKSSKDFQPSFASDKLEGAPWNVVWEIPPYSRATVVGSAVWPLILVPILLDRLDRLLPA